VKEETWDKFANKALQYLEGTEAFLKEQLPDYFQQVVTYHAISSYVWTGISIVVLIISGHFFKKGLLLKDKYGDVRESGLALCVGSGVFFAIFAISFCCSLETALKATLAPKVFIVDYLRGKE
jgi:hypothetical protein